MEPMIVEEDCISCSECININPNIFAYNDSGKAFIKNAKGGPYRDIVKAAERCGGSCIKPGTPLDPAEKDVDKWVARAQKYNE